jgi:Domain of unknown function (DUF397)
VTEWKKSSYSAHAGNCVEVAELSRGKVGVRDSKNGNDGPVLTVTLLEWKFFLALARAGEFDPS